MGIHLVRLTDRTISWKLRFNFDAVRARHSLNKAEEVQRHILGTCYPAAMTVPSGLTCPTVRLPVIVWRSGAGWMAVDIGPRAGQSQAESAELRGARKRIRLLEQETQLSTSSVSLGQCNDPPQHLPRRFCCVSCRYCVQEVREGRWVEARYL